MTTFLNKDTNEEFDIKLIDPKTDTDCFHDIFTPLNDDNLSISEEDDTVWVGDTDTVEYYKDTVSQYQSAYNLIHEVKLEGTEEQKEKLEEVLADAGHYEFNDWAGYVIQDIKEKIKK